MGGSTLVTDEKQLVDPVLRDVADKILHELPEDLAGTVVFRLHEGGDSWVLSYPVGLHGTPQMQVLDGVVRGFGGAFVSRGEGKSYYLVPKPKIQQPVAEKPKEEPKTAVSVSESVTGVTNVTKDTKLQSAEKPQETPKQPSPITWFGSTFCAVCEDSGKCDLSTVEGKFRFASCLQVLDLQQKQQLNVWLGKLANRPAYSRSSPPQKPLPVERHVDGGISWLWDENRNHERYEKALESENAASQAYLALKQRLVDATTAGKKGVVDGGKWCFLSTQKDWVGRKPAKDFSNGGNK